MASNHVQSDQSLQNAAALFGDGQDAYGYTNLYAQAQPFPNNLLSDQQNPRLTGTPPSHSPYSSASAFSPPAWQPSASPSSIANPQPPNQYLTTGRGYYGLPPSNTPNSFISGHAVQFNQNVDPSLFRQGDNRAFPQPMGLPPTNAQSATPIVPASLHQAPPVSRPAGSPASSMQNVFSAQAMANQQRELARAPAVTPAATPVVNGGTAVQAPKAPKGTQSGNFIIVTFEDLAKATQSKKLHNYVNIGSHQIDLNLSKVNIPQYVPRKSHNELKALAASDPTIRAKIMKRVKKSKSHVLKPGRSLQTPTNKGSPVSLSSETESSDDDSDSSYDSDASPPPEKSPLPATRPQKAVEAVRYDTIKAVWFPRNKFAANDRILKGLADLWEVVRTIRDRWKTDRDAVKKALESKQDSELPLLRERVDKQLEMMEAVLTAAVEFGHHDLLSACGQNVALMLVCYQFILEPVREGNYTGTFIKAVFKFLSLCTNLNGEIAEKSGLSKLFTRSVKRGNEEIKALTTKINENIAAATKRTKSAKASDVKPAKAADSPTKPIKQESDSVAGVKRPRPTEGSVGQPAKRVASGSTALGSKDSAAAKLGLVKKAGTTTAPAPAAAAKAKTVKPPASTFFAGLQSASKKPGTSKADQAKKPAIGVAPEKKGPVPSAPVAAARPAFSFAETMANLSKEKEQEQQPTKKKAEDKREPETEEQKAKRLRKEERRKLRVRWKTGLELVEIRHFSPDPSEVPNKVRNVRDVGNGKDKEGFTLKKHMDMMDVDEEDDDQPIEQTYFEYRDPTAINFSTVPEDERKRNFERFGGYQTVNSTERAIQDNHEATTLMVHYLDGSDIPPNPREPADPYTGPQVETKMFGFPDDTSSWLLARLDKTAAPVPQVDISALLQSFGTATTQQPAPPQPVLPTALPDLSAIHNIISQVNNTAPPQQSVQPQPTFPWPSTTQPPAPAADGQGEPKSIDAILAALGANPAAPAVQESAPPAPQDYQPAATTTAPAPSSDVTALLARLMQNAQAGGAAAPANAYQGYSIPGVAEQDQGQNNFYGSPSASSTQYPNNANSTDQQAGANGKRKWLGNANKKFTHPCRFWKEGKCKKGDACTFKHE